MSAYCRRVVDDELDELLPHLPAVSLDGARGVGKTTTALQRAGAVFRLDDPGTLEIVTADPKRLARGAEPIVVDEWQRYPPSWDIVRRAVDEDPRPGRFILTGSAAPADRPTHSGAGRIVSVRMRPLALSERWAGRSLLPPTVSLSELAAGGRPDVDGETEAGLEDYAAEIAGGGFPGLRDLSGRARRAALRGYVDRLIEADFVEAGRRVRNREALLRWMTAYAAATSTTASYEKIRGAAAGGHGDKPNRKAAARYIDALERLWMIDPVPAWTPARSRFTKLTGGPKHHLADPALAVTLLGLGVGALLGGSPAGPPIPRGGTLLGALFESLAALNLRVYAQACEAGVRHLRKRGAQREVDFVVVRPDDRVVAVEVKLSQSVDDRDVRHLRWLSGELGEDLLDAVVMTTGAAAYRRADGIAVVPAALLGP